MASTAQTIAQAAAARRFYVEGLVAGLPAVVQGIDYAARLLLTQTADPATTMRRRDAVEDLKRAGGHWLQGALAMLRGALQSGIVSATRPNDLPMAGGRQSFSLVDNETIEGEILSSRLALAVMDRASWEFTDLRSRMTLLEGREELDANDVLRPHVLARIVITAWRAAGLSQDAWLTLQSVLHEEFAHFNEEAYHEANRLLIQQRVLPDVDLRPLVRRARNSAVTSAYAGLSPNAGAAAVGPAAGKAGAVNVRTESSGEARLGSRAGVGGEPGGVAGTGRGSADHAEAVMGRLNRLIGRQLPDFANSANARPASPSLVAAISNAQQGIALRLNPEGSARSAAGPVSTPAMLEGRGDIAWRAGND
jgi:hypothetical protein